MAGQHRRAVLTPAVCSLTNAPASPPPRAKPHQLGPRAVSALTAIVLGLGIAACDPPLPSEDASPSDAGPSADVGLVSDAALADAAVAQDAAAADVMSLDAGMTSGRGSLASGAHEVLFVGNSYVYTGDVPSRYEALLAGAAARIESVAPGGYRLTQHATDAETDGTALATWLRTGTLEQRAFDVVVLQEQSQIGGFPEGQADRVASLDGASRLAALATANGSAIVLYVTWGREHGDETNPGLYPDFSAMQDRLDAGYRAMAARLRDEGARVRLAPVGPAFRAVHDDVVAMGGDPEAVGSDFDRLYSPDGSHPSIEGAYLIAVVIEASIAGEDPVALADAPDVDPTICAHHRDIASRVMSDPSWETELR